MAHQQLVISILEQEFYQIILILKKFQRNKVNREKVKLGLFKKLKQQPLSSSISNPQKIDSSLDSPPPLMTLDQETDLEVEQTLLEKYSYSNQAVDKISDKLQEIFKLMSEFSQNVFQQEEMT